MDALALTLLEKSKYQDRRLVDIDRAEYGTAPALDSPVLRGAPMPNRHDVAKAEALARKIRSNSSIPLG